MREADAPPVGSDSVDRPGGLELWEARESRVGRMTVRRTLPRRAHRTVGAWCFADHLGPTTVTETHGVDTGPHPHNGLQVLVTR